MEVLIVGVIIMGMLIYNNTIDKNKFIADNEKYLQIFREEDYNFLVYAKYGEDVDVDQLYIKRVFYSIIAFFVVFAFTIGSSSSDSLIDSQFFLNLVLAIVVAVVMFKSSYCSLKRYY